MVRISVCLPLYNAEKYLAPTLDTLAQQTERDWELVVVDNASTDNTLVIVEKYRLLVPHLRIVRQNKTVSASDNWNTALKAGTGKYIALYHGDDLYHPGILKKQADFLDANHSCVAVFTESEEITHDGRHKGYLRAPGFGCRTQYNITSVIRSLALDGYDFLVCPTFMVRRKAMGAGPWFDSKLKTAFDIDYYLRLLHKSSVGVIREVLHKYRRSSAQGGVVKITTTTEPNEIYSIIDKHMAVGYFSLSDEEQNLYNARKTADWWIIAFNAEAAGKSDVASQIWKERFNFDKLFLVASHRVLWPKAAAATGYDVLRRLGLQTFLANAIHLYRIKKETGEWKPLVRRGSEL
jgi:glycosyltransferase involved in cell wall biosynthesis